MSGGLLRRVTIFAASLVMIGCSTIKTDEKPPSPPIREEQNAANWNDPKYVGSLVKIQTDEYAKVTFYSGPMFHPKKDSTARVSIVGYQKNGGNIGFAVRVLHDYIGSWRFYDSAYDINGAKLIVKKISSGVVSCRRRPCSLEEEVAIEVDRAYLNRARLDGMKLKLYGSSAALEFEIPSGYVDGFMAQIPR